MKVLRELGIGQKLWIGFLLVFTVFAALLVIVAVTQGYSTRAQLDYTENIAPRAELAQDLESQILYVALRGRRYLLQSEPERLAGYRHARERADRTLEALQDSAGADPRVAECAARLEKYFALYDERIAKHALEGTTGEQEAALSELRENALDPLRDFAAMQREAAAHALTAMGRARERVWEMLLAASTSSLLLLCLIAALITRSVTRPTEDLLAVAAALRAGDWRPALAKAAPGASHGRPLRNEFVQLGHAFGDAARALQRRELRLRTDGVIANATAAGLDKTVIGEGTLRAVADYVRAEVAAVYWCAPGSSTLVPVASHALKGDAVAVEIGEGLPGQAAKERRTIVLRDVPADTPFAVKLGYDQSPPKAVAAVPITFGSAVLGVMLVASLRDFDADTLSFLDHTALQLGIGLQNAHSYEEIGRLLAEVRDKNEHIQAQNEELQSQNEEIQAQHEELQVQAEELQAQNEQLLFHADQITLQGATLAEADKRKNEFLGVLAHELRNPMAAILNCLGILKEAPAGGEQVNRAQTMLERQTNHLIRLVDDLLDITRISQGKIQLRLQRLDLSELLCACIDDHASALEKRGLVLRHSLPGAPVWVRGDHTRMSQIVGNLLSNSIKFTDPPGEVMIEMDVRDTERQALVRVADTGIGIHPAFMSQLFEPFWQSADTLDRGNGGLGLGLALVKSLVYLHGGSIEAHSDGLGLGTSFTVRLPLATANGGISVPGDGFGSHESGPA